MKDYGLRLQVWHMEEVHVLQIKNVNLRRLMDEDVRIKIFSSLHIMVLHYKLVAKQKLMVDMDDMLDIMFVDIHYNHWHGSLVVSDLKVS